MAGLLPLAIAALIAFLVVHYSGAKAWHGIVFILLGAFLTTTAIGPALSAVLSEVRGLLSFIPGM